ncbi:tetratricopeptide repeat protein [Paenibacillus sp. GYB003]|uniref:tetratricopeptide repeat protein n=1 Tax=Paenibacillus sp. GYB003 TaxID=2994392 RepID=UPI002F96D910
MFEWLYLVYVLITGVVLAVFWRKDRREWGIRFAFASALPVIGFALPLFWPKGMIGRNGTEAAESEQFDLFDFELEKESRLLPKPNAEKEMNIVPLEEALLVNDYSTRRKMIIDLLKQDSLSYMGIIQNAVSNDDTETSHYAVSAIMEVKRKLTLKLQELSVRYENDKDDPYLLRAYADVLAAYMGSGFLDDRTIVKHKRTYTALLARLLELSPEEEKAYADKIRADLELGEYLEAERTARSFLQRFPNREDAYMLMMEVYFTAGSYEKLRRTLEALKKSPVRLSSESLTTVRFWSEGA